MDNPTIGFIGAGTLATGLAMALHGRGYRVVAVASRNVSSARRLGTMVPGCLPMELPSDLVQACDLVFVTVPDDSIKQVTDSLQWKPGLGVVHCCGAGSLHLLESASALGAMVGSFHPFQTLACLESPEEAAGRLQGITFAVDGTGWLLPFLQRAAVNLGGRSIRIDPKNRTLYHASAVMACGYVTALLKAAGDIWQHMGYSAEDARSALGPLVTATVTNFSRVGAEGSVTGPVVRGDTKTLSEHLHALEAHMPHLLPLFTTLGLESATLMTPEVAAQSRQPLTTLMAKYGEAQRPESP